MQENPVGALIKAKHEAKILRENATKGRAPFQFLTEVFLTARAEEKEKEAIKITKSDES